MATEVTERRGGDTPMLALTIPNFCRAHGISTAFFYLLQQRGEAPRVMHVGARRLISIEEAAAWRKERTAVEG
jgi:predicted DNA-binding transcriptional regulator AlpA